MTDETEILANEGIDTSTEAPLMGETGIGETTPQSQPQTLQEFEFNSNGQTIKVPFNDQRLKRWAEMGYSAPQTISKYQQEIQAREARIRDYDSKFKDYETKYKPYQEIDAWARQNPQAWQVLEQNWRAQLQGMSPQQISQLPPEVKQQLDETKQFIEQTKQERQIQREHAADQNLDTEIQSIRKEYSNIDFGNPQDPNSLEMQVLRHAMQNGLPSFRAAFRDYFHDQLVQFSKDQGRETAGKALQKTRNLGLPGSPAPKSRGQSPDLRKLSYEQINELALQELGLG